MAIQFGQYIGDYGGTGGEATPTWRDSETGGYWDYSAKPWDSSKVDFGTPPIPGATPIINNAGFFAGWQTPNGMQWAPSGQFIGRGEGQVTENGWTGQMGQALPGDLAVSPWMKYGTLGALAAMGGYGALAGAGALGAAGAAGGGGAAAAPAGASWGLTGGAFGTGGAATAADVAAALGTGGTAGGAAGSSAASSAIPGMNPSGGWGFTGNMPAPGMMPTGIGGSSLGGFQMPSMSQVGQGASALGGLTGAGGSQQQGQGSGMGGLLGSLIGGGLGYLDAANQPNELTVRNEIDPRLANAYYGTGGLLEQAQGIYGQQQGQPNYLGQAGQQITNMANTALPGYNEAVKNNQSLYDYNPFVQQQTEAITKNATRNMLENIFPQIGSEANAAGGYGSSRHGIAQGLATSRLNQDLAPTIAALGSNAFENAQNRAQAGAGQQLNYGLQNQAQTAGLLGTGATMQQGAPWANFNQLANFTRGLPGGSSTTTPLFTNTTAGALGGANLGGQVGSSTNWGDIFQGVGSGFNWLNDIFRRS